MTGSGLKQEAKQNLTPAIFAEYGAEGQQKFQFRTQQEQFEEPSDILFHHAAELRQVSSWIFEHGDGRAIRNIEVRGGSL